MGDELLSRMTSKGQVTIPSILRKELQLNPGDTVIFGRDDLGLTLHVRKSRLRSGFGAAGKLPHALTDDEIEEAFEEELADEATSKPPRGKETSS
jgi:AbrB family looped-hinge helix DNA binding protein